MFKWRLANNYKGFSLMGIAGIFLLLAIGGAAGFLSGLLGVGGGIVLVPGLYYVMRVLGYNDPSLMHIAVATSLAIIVPTGFSSARAHLRRNSVGFDLLRKIGPGILAGVAAGALIADALSGQALKAVFAVALMALAAIMLVNPARFRLADEVPGQPWSGMAGFVIGTVSTLIGIGGATLSVPYMTQHNVPMHRAVGTASALGLIIAVPATVAYIITGLDEPVTLPWSLGYVNMLAWLLVIPASTMVAPLGVAAAHKLPVDRLRVVFAVFITIVSFRMFYDVLHG